MKAKIEQVRRDLRRLRRLEHTVEVYTEVRERYEKHLAHLKSISDPTEDILKSITEAESFIEKSDIAEKIHKTTEISERYIDAINKLDHLDRTIIFDAFINGKPYWKIGKEIGYTERGVQYRVEEAIKAIAKGI